MSDKSDNVTGLRVTVGDRTIEIPRKVEAEGGAAIEAYIAEQLAPETEAAPEPTEE